jgi:putative intracellular protease/amidase
MSNRRKIGILVESEYIPEELRDYQDVFSAAGYEVQLMSRLWNQPSLEFFSDVIEVGKTPETIKVDVDFQNVSLDEYAAILVAANYVSVRLRYFEQGTNPRNSPAVQFFARAMRDPQIVKGALCHALWLLTPTPEHLAGRRVICHEVVQADIQNAGAIITYTDTKVVVDEDLVTGHSKAEARTLAQAVVAQIGNLQQASPAPIPAPAVISNNGTSKKNILMVLSERGYWGEELIGPLEEFDRAGYHVDFCTPTGKRPNAIPVSMDPNFIDPPLGRAVTSEEMAKKVREIDDPSTGQGCRLERPLNLSQWIPERPYASTPVYVRALEAYNRRLNRALERIKQYDALVLVGGSGPLLDMVNNGRVHDLILGFVGQGKIVAAECYGVACLAFARDWQNRKSIITGKRVTGHCIEYDYHDGTAFVKARNIFEDFNMGPPPYPLEFILRDAVGPEGEFIGNFGKETSVIVDLPFITGRSTPDSYLTGQKVVEVLETGGPRQWGWPTASPDSVEQ